MALPDLAAVARLGARATVSHEAAAALWGIELVGEPRHRLTVPLQRSRLVVPGWEVRRLDLPADDVVVVDGVRLTTQVRTILDLTQVLPLAHAVAAADSALRKELVGVEELVPLLASRRGRHAAAARAVAGLVDPLAGSVLESLLRVLLHLGGVPAPRTQYSIADSDGAFVGRVDFAWPGVRLVVEADGFAFHSDRAAYRSDRRRTNALEQLGWRVLRFSWEDVVHAPEQVVATIRACLAQAA